MQKEGRGVGWGGGSSEGGGLPRKPPVGGAESSHSQFVFGQAPSQRTHALTQRRGAGRACAHTRVSRFFATLAEAAALSSSMTNEIAALAVEGGLVRF